MESKSLRQRLELALDHQENIMNIMGITDLEDIFKPKCQPYSL